MCLERNYAKVFAAGLYDVFIKPKTEDREAIVAHLEGAFECTRAGSSAGRWTRT